MAKTRKTFAEEFRAELEAEILEEDIAKRREKIKVRLREIREGKKVVARMEAQLRAELDAIEAEYGQ